MRLNAPWLLAMAGALAPPGLAAQEQAASVPNILFITVDTLRADHLSCYGYHLKTSPNIDRLASEGVRYDRAYTVTTRTAPSHYSMFTSRYPHEHGAKLNGFAVPKETKLLFLPQVLKKFGYRTAGFVSAWPLTARLTNLDHWFDDWNQDLDRSYQKINSSRWAEDVTPKAANWLERNKEGPFFLWIHYFDPHSPYDFRDDFAVTETSGHPENLPEGADGELKQLYRDYDSEVRYVDHHVQKLLDRLDKLGLRDSTLVVLVADHGEALQENGYRGHSRRTYESILRVPFIMRLPGKLPAGKVVSEHVSLLDLAPTILDLTVRSRKTDVDTHSTFTGRSLASNAARGEKLAERPVRFMAFPGQKWFFPGWLAKLWLRGLDFPIRLGQTVGDQKIVWTPEKDELRVYDLASDLFEQNPKVVDRGDSFYQRETAKLERWYESTELEQGEAQMTDADREALKSLGYIN